MDKLVSVIIPTYKGQSTLRRAIKSIAAQTYKNVEIIVVDDNSPDSEARRETEAVISKIQLKQLKYVKHEKNKNGAAARNTGISSAQGEYICFLDDDDVYLPTRIEKSVAVLERNANVGMVFCDVVHVQHKNQLTAYRIDDDRVTVRNMLLQEAAIGTGSNLFVRRDVVEAVRGFNTQFLRHQDLEFAIRVRKQTDAECIGEILIVKGYNGTNNNPNYIGMCNVKKLFNTVFRDDIESLSEDDRTKYYYQCYMRLYQAALDFGEKKEILKCVKNAQEYGFNYGMKRKVQVLLASKGFYRNKVLNKIFYKRHINKDGAADEQLTSDKKYEIEQCYFAECPYIEV